jgi:5-hydroxyisourate hydrolase-like protein (transthyretin family)
MRWLLALIASVALGAVDGTVKNSTTGEPQPGATVTLYKITENGPESLESVKSDPAGKFVINQTVAGGPHLIQTAYQGVTYNRMLPPGTPTTGVGLEVFNALKTPGAAKATQHMILLEPAGDKLSVRESYFFKNDGKTTWNDAENGTLRVLLTVEPAGKVAVTAQAPQGMPIQRVADKTNQKGVYKVDFPIKPGETRLDLSYDLPFSNPGTYESKMLVKADMTMLAVPAGVTVKGEGIEEQGQEPNTQASVYKLTGDVLKLELNGTGTLSPADAQSENEGPAVQQIPAKIQGKLPWILGLSFSILGIGFYLLYRSPQPTQGKK